MTLSSAEVSVPLCRREPGKRENESASETMGRRKSGIAQRLPPSSSSHGPPGDYYFNYSTANYPAGAPAEERVIYEARRNNRLRQIVLLIDSDQNTTVVLIIVETATLLILDGRL